MSPTQPAPSAARSSDRAKGRYAFVSLGCPKNLVDSERMLGQLELDGYLLVDRPEGTDFVVVNTCGFIDQARRESFAVIDEMLELKRRGETHGVIVAGCLAERQREELLVERPEIDGLIGVFARDEVTRIADRLLGRLTEQRHVFQPAPIRAMADLDRMRITPKHFAYLKISEGCDRLCTFCAIPKMRGKHASKPIETIVREAEQLAADGVRELIIVAQDTTYYGKDLYGQPRLGDLLTQLESIPDIEWIRLMYLYPMYFDDRLIEQIAGSSKIVPYVDLPLQHISDRVLRRMARQVTREQTESLLAKLRRAISNLVIRTTLLTGFPGETEDDFAELVAFVQEQRFERLGVFEYSLEPDTPAARLDGHLPDDVKQQRRNRLMEVQQPVAFAYNRSQMGRPCDVILDRAIPEEANVFVGRTSGDAPEIDGSVYVTGGEQRLDVGQIVPCEIVATQEYDLVAVAVGPGR